MVRAGGDPEIRILALYPYALGPDRLGGLIRARLWVAWLARRHSVTLAEVLPPEEAERPEAGSDPALASLAARRRFAAPAWGRLGAARALAAATPSAAAFLAQPPALGFVEGLLREARFDVAYVEFSLLAEFGRLFSALGLPAVLAEQEIVSRRHGRAGRAARAALWRRYERRALARFADLWVISPEERDYAAGRLGRAAPYLFPNVVAPEAFPVAARAPERRTAAFFGNFAHAPNASGLRWLLREVWPRVRAREPRAALRVYGREAAADLVEEVRRAGGAWEGFAPDLPAAIAGAEAVLCPMVDGGGMRGKVLEALAVGRPAVATPIGAEGVEIASGLRVAEGPEAFADALLALWASPEAAREEGLAASEAVRRRYGAPEVFEAAERRLEAAAA